MTLVLPHELAIAIAPLRLSKATAPPVLATNVAAVHLTAIATPAHVEDHQASSAPLLTKRLHRSPVVGNLPDRRGATTLHVAQRRAPSRAEPRLRAGTRNLTLSARGRRAMYIAARLRSNFGTGYSSRHGSDDQAALIARRHRQPPFRNGSSPPSTDERAQRHAVEVERRPDAVPRRNSRMTPTATPRPPSGNEAVALGERQIDTIWGHHERE